MLFAERDGVSLALSSSTVWLKRSVGFVGTSDGWQDLSQHYTMKWNNERAENGNVALIGQFGGTPANNETILSLGFGRTFLEAGQRSLASLEDDFDVTKNEYCNEWEKWISHLNPVSNEIGDREIQSVSRTVLRTHESKQFQGGVIASLSIPWGMSKSDNDLGGYHLVWPRDLVETAGAMLAVGANNEAIRVANFLQSTQEDDGHWSQNMWLDGTPYWGGLQMDETAFPILLVDLLKRELHWQDEWKRYWPMIRQAACYLVRNGPVTLQDRWEEDSGFSPFTLAVEIAGLLAAADFAELSGESAEAAYLRETADIWNEGIERWTYVTETELAKKVGVEGYYVRISPPEVADAASPKDGFVPIKNRPPNETIHRAEEIVSPDALALVRFGLRSANDPRIKNTIRVIDATLKHEFPKGPCWYRYNGDGYGEHENGQPFDGTGIGRPWPLLTGERAHYELAVGNYSESQRLCKAFESFARKGGMLPEQIWDTDDKTEHGLKYGAPSGSAMPLVWAHSEYLKLVRSIEQKRIFDMPSQTVERYLSNQPENTPTIWRYNNKSKAIRFGQKLRIELQDAAQISWTIDNWNTVDQISTNDTRLGMHILDLSTESLIKGKSVIFTILWTEKEQWEGEDFHLEVV